MRINELEFQDTNGNEINPTKQQMATFIADLNNKNKQLERDLAVRDRAYKLLLEWTIKNANKLMKNEVINGLEDAFGYSFIEQAEKELKGEK